MTQTPALDTGNHQHEQVRAAIYGVAETTTAESRQEAFDRLREMLGQHESAEEKIVLAELEELDIASLEFARLFEKFAGAVLAPSSR